MIRVLVVDSDAAMVRTIGRELVRRGHRASDAYGPASALSAVISAILDGTAFHLAIIDVDVADSFELCRRLRKQCPGAVVVMMAGLVTSQRITDAREAGALDIYDKCDVVSMLGGILDSVERHGSPERAAP